MANDDFSEPPRCADSKNPISFFPDFWVWVISKAWGSDSVGFWGSCQLSPFLGEGGGPAGGLYRPPPPPPKNENPASPTLETLWAMLMSEEQQEIAPDTPAGNPYHQHCKIVLDRHSALGHHFEGP